MFVSGFSALDSRFSALAAFHFPISTGFFAFPFVALLRGGVNGSGIAGGGGYCLWLGSPSCQIDCKKGPLLGSFTFVIGGLFAAGSASLSFPFHSFLSFPGDPHLRPQQVSDFRTLIPAAANRVGI